MPDTPSKKFKPTPLSGKLNRDVLFGTSADLPRIIELRLDEIHPNPDQPRKTFDETKLRELADSIREKGLIQPITVKRRPEGEEGYYVVAGERRLRAFQILERETIPAIQTEGNIDEIALIENIQREGLQPLEEAEAMARMIERHGYSQDELARVVGKARNTVNEALQLNTLPEEIKRECRTSDTLSKYALIELSRERDPKRQLAMWEELRRGRATVKAARAVKKGERAEPKPSSPAGKLLAAARHLKQQLASTIADDLTEEEFSELLQLHESIGRYTESIKKARH